MIFNLIVSAYASKRLERFNYGRMTVKTLQIILTATLLTSCNLFSSDDYELTVLFNDADGLTTNSQVKLNGITIGQVRTIKLGQDNKVVTTISINKEYGLPSDSRAYLTKDFLGVAAIEVYPGLDIEMFKDGQQIEGQKQKIDFDKELNIDNALEFVDKLLDPGRKTTQDSILLELKRLNKNVERLLEKE
ncbi:MlaD family protein [Flagellimonas myxillae]|uniref:MlaD family protein n=1 Tax=Flagellimonas myxillae TaxID=2942214 RepID=UPI00201F67FD|nr:MCE family protein [Muricauda myxillae]MCL6265562.1 MlaD family protein [Muricauda myxillae]